MTKNYHIHMIIENNGSVKSTTFLSSEKRLHEIIGRNVLAYGIPEEDCHGNGEHILSFFKEGEDSNYKAITLIIVEDEPTTVTLVPPLPVEVISSPQIVNMEKLNILTRVS